MPVIERIHRKDDMTDEAQEQDAPRKKGSPKLDTSLRATTILELLHILALQYDERNQKTIDYFSEKKIDPIRHARIDISIRMTRRGVTEITESHWSALRFPDDAEHEGLTIPEQTIRLIAAIIPRAQGLLTIGIGDDGEEVKPVPAVPDEWTKL